MTTEEVMAMHGIGWAVEQMMRGAKVLSQSDLLAVDWEIAE